VGLRWFLKRIRRAKYTWTGCVAQVVYYEIDEALGKKCAPAVRKSWDMGRADMHVCTTVARLLLGERKMVRYFVNGFHHDGVFAK